MYYHETLQTLCKDRLFRNSYLCYSLLASLDCYKIYLCNRHYSVGNAYAFLSY